VALESAKHPEFYGPGMPSLLPMVGDADTGIACGPGDYHLSFVVEGREVARSLAKSLSGTRERVAANVMNRVFELDTPFDLSSLEEVEVDIGGSNDKRRARITDSNS